MAKLWRGLGNITGRFCTLTRLEILGVSFYDEASSSLLSERSANVENAPAHFGDIKDAEAR